MAADEMEIDSNPLSTCPTVSEKERKRKLKHKDESSSSPSKKKRKQEKADKDTEKKSKKKKDKSDKSKSKDKKSSTIRDSTSQQQQQQQQRDTVPDSPYSLTTATLYLPLSPISISPTHALASLLAEHLSPLLLTYYPPFKGIILAYSNASISSFPPSSSPSDNNPADSDPSPQPLTLATTAGEYGVMYVYLTATFLVFRPQRGQTLEGWINVQSEGFLGAVVLNLFSVGIERKRLPQTWKWIPPGEEDDGNNNKQEKPSTTSSPPSSDDENTGPAFDPEKEHFNPVALASDANPFSYDSLDQNTTTYPDGSGEEGKGEGTAADEAVEGYFQSVSGHRVRGTVKFRVVDIDVIPGTERDRGFLSIEGTMLSPEEEAMVAEDERNGVMAPSSTVRKSFRTPLGSSAMSGGVVVAVDGEVAETPSKKPKGKAKER